MGIREKVEQFKGEWKAAGEAIERNNRARARRQKPQPKNGGTVTGPVIDVTSLINDSGCHHSSGCTD